MDAWCLFPLIQQTGTRSALWSIPLTPAWEQTLTLICHYTSQPLCFWPTRCLISNLFIWQQPNTSCICESLWLQSERYIKVGICSFDMLDESRQSWKFVFLIRSSHARPCACLSRIYFKVIGDVVAMERRCDFLLSDSGWWGFDCCWDLGQYFGL